MPTAKYKVFNDSSLQTLLNQTKANKSIAAQNKAAIDGLEDDFQGMTTQVNEVLVEVENCLDALDETKADVTAVEQALANKAEKSAIPTKTSQLTNDSGFKTTDNNTTYSISKSGSTITLTGSDGSTTSVTDADTNTTYSKATSSALGLVKIGFPESGKNYPVELNTDGQMFVNVPWTDNNTTYNAAGSSLGLVKSGGDVTISDGVITVKDDSHAHVISNVDGLQTALDGKETAGAANTALASAKSYTDTQIAGLINGAPTTLDTLGEIATAMADNADVVEALETAIGNKADKSAIPTKTSQLTNDSGFKTTDNNTTYTLTKSGSTITLTGSDGKTSSVTDSDTDTKYTHPSNTAYSSGLYKVTVDNLGHVTSATAVAKSDITALGIPSSDTKYTHPSYTAKSSGLYKVTVDSTGHVSGTTAVTKDDITALGIPGSDTNTTYNQATSSALGLVKIGYSENGKNYPVELNSSGQMFVNVPWTDNNTVYTHPSYTAKSSGLYKVTVDGTGHVSGTAAVAKADITALGIPGSDTNTTYTLTKDGSNIILTGSDGSTTSVTDSNNTYSNASLGQGYGTCSTAEATVAKAVTLSSYALTKGGVVAVKFTYAVPAGATMNINSKGAKAIYYKGKAIVAGVICAGEVATFVYDGSYYHLLTVDRNRFFNSLVPYGTSIEASESSTVDLNTATYQKVGNYFCSSNAKAKYVSNIPKKDTAFMMQVYSPLSQTVDNETGTWVYRLRKIQYYTGEEYVQYNYTNGTGGNWQYGPWKKLVTSDELQSLTDRITALETALAGKQDKIASWSDLKG